MARTPPPRLHLLLAQEAPVGVIIRRGPTRRWTTFGWDVRSDRITTGDVLHGGMAPEICDLSPDGRHLLYFANYAHLPGVPGFDRADSPFIWTALSRAPGLVPLGAWPRNDSWSGGGYFVSETEAVLLQHFSDLLVGQDEVNEFQGVKVSTWVDHPAEVRGEQVRLLRRDWEPEPGDTWAKPAANGVTLVRLPFGDRYRLRTADADLDLGPRPWADVDQLGRVVYPDKGSMWVIDCRREDPTPQLLVDLTDIAG